MNGSGVYAITCRPTGRVYIGSSARVASRLRRHRVELLAGKHHSSKLQRAWNKYGARAFAFEPLLRCGPDALLLYEQRAIDGFDAVDRGFNICPTAGSVTGVIRSAAFRARMREIATGRPVPPSLLEHLRRLAQHRHENGLPAACRAKVAASNTRRFKGVPLSAEHRRKISEGLIGRRLSAESRAKIGNAGRGRTHSDVTRLKMSVAQTGRRHSAESKAKIAGAKRGHVVSAETRAKIAATKANRRRSPT